MWELQQRLLPKSAQSLRTGQPLVLIIDGADRLVDQRGQLISDWIPKILPRVSVRRRRGGIRLGEGGSGGGEAGTQLCPHLELLGILGYVAQGTQEAFVLPY